MAWPTPKAEDVIGMTADELKNKLEATVTKADLEKSLEPVAALQGSIAQIQESLKALTVAPPEKKPPENNNDDVDPAVRVLTDPDKFLRDGTKDLSDRQLQTQADLNEMRARQDSRFGKLFGKYGKELTESAAKVPLASRAHPGFWEFHVRQFVGDLAIQGKINSDSYPTLLGSSSITSDDDADNKDGNFGFSQDMADFFRGRGKDLGKMAFLRDRMSRDGDVIDLSTWKKKPNAA